MCGLVIDHKDGHITSIKGDPDDPFSKGHICPKAVALQDLHNDPDRLKKPLCKTVNGWQEISWEEAFNQVVRRIREIQEKYGQDAVSLYQGNPSVHSMGSMFFAPSFARVLGTKNKYSATSIDQLPHHWVAQHIFGHMMLIPIPDIDRTDFFLVLGANPMVSNGGLMTTGGFSGRLKSLQARGGKMVVIDPRYSETAAVAHKHFFIQPGTDALFLLEMIRTLLMDGLMPDPKLHRMISGWDQLKKIILDQPPDLALPTGIRIFEIQTLARDFASASAAVCYGRMGVSTQAFGSLCQWLINVLNILTGNLDRAGGAMFTRPAVDIVKALGKNGTQKKKNRWHSRVRKLGEFFGELPVATLADEIIAEGQGQIKALITSAGNPVLSTPNGKRLSEALGKLEYQVAIDIYINETTKHADIILPPATGLETDHYDLVFHNFAVRNSVKFSEALFSPDPNARYDWQIFKELTKRLRKTPLPWWKNALEKWSTPKRLLDLALRLGPYGQIGGRKLSGLSLKKVQKYPHGIDLGPLEPSLPSRLFTRDKRIDLMPDPMVYELGRLKKFRFSVRGSKLLLIGRRHLRSNNSWMHNSLLLVKGPNRCTLLMHPTDAQIRGLESGKLVKVTSGIGIIYLPLQISEEIMPGVVSIPHGWGHHEIPLTIASEHPGVSINDLTDPMLLDQVSGTVAFSGVPVEVI